MFKKYVWVQQDDIKDCGVCSLLTIVKTYGGNVSKEYLRDLTKTSKDGTNAFYLLEAGRKLGFDVKALKGDVLDLTNELLPCIAHVIVDNKFQHFVVIVDINKKKKIITISDPARGIIKYKLDDYNKISTNQYLIYIPIKPIPILLKNKKIGKIIFSFIQKYKTVLLSIFLFSLLYTVINIVTSFNFQLIIENVLTYSSKNNLYFIMLTFLFLYLLKSVIDYVRSNMLIFINHTLDNELILNVFKHIISLPYLYYKSRTTGEVISRINDLGDIKETISKLFMTIFVDLILVVFVLFMLLKINYKLTLIGIVIVILYLIIVKLFNKSFRKYIKRIQEDGAVANSYMIESINNIDTVKSLGLEEINCDQMSIKYNTYLNSNYEFQKMYNLENFFKDLINYVGLSIIIGLSTLFVLEGEMTIGEILTYNSMIIYFLEPIKGIIDLEVIIKKTKSSIERVTELYEIKAEELAIDKKYNGGKLNGDIEVRDLNYSYYGRKNIFERVNFKVNSGEKVMIYGKSGSGKSTIGKILMKFFDVERDKVFIDNKDINDYNTLDIRREVCYIGQNENLFNDTIYNNIILHRNISYDEFLKVVNITKVNDVVKNNVLSYEMTLEENGFNISGGERQRVILARSLIKKSSIYILDESLSQVDVLKEREILDDLFKELKDKTIIYISHRFDNADLFDKSINMEENYV